MRHVITIGEVKVTILEPIILVVRTAQNGDGVLIMGGTQAVWGRDRERSASPRAIQLKLRKSKLIRTNTRITHSADSRSGQLC
jgi:hypothetical protein